MGNLRSLLARDQTARVLRDPATREAVIKALISAFFIWLFFGTPFALTQVKSVEETYGIDNLHLAVARGYVSKLLANGRISRWLAYHCQEYLREFQKIAEIDVIGPVGDPGGIEISSTRRMSSTAGPADCRADPVFQLRFSELALDLEACKAPYRMIVSRMQATGTVPQGERENRGGKNLRVVECFSERALVDRAVEDEHLGRARWGERRSSSPAESAFNGLVNGRTNKKRQMR